MITRLASNKHDSRNSALHSSHLLPIEILEEAAGSAELLLLLEVVEVLEEDPATISDITDVNIVVTVLVVDLDACILLVVLFESCTLGNLGVCAAVGSAHFFKI